VWHASTQELQASGKLKVTGIALEQHGDRTRLFMQWKQMSWPVMIDPLNLLEMKAVPVTVLIDEYGVVRKINPREEDLREFLATKFQPPPAPDTTDTLLSSASPAMDYAIGTVTGNRTEQLNQAIRWLSEEMSTSPESGLARFRLGVLYRLRYDSLLREEGDFGRAVDQWSKALALDPNQYIWRRRIQQYGPRLDKPYPFYDWVTTARAEIRARGEQPLPLLVEPQGAEIAHAARDTQDPPTELITKHPDPGDRLASDDGLIQVQTTIVPSTDPDSTAFRVHLELRPSKNRQAHWNNEVDVLALWLNDPPGWTCRPNPVLHVPAETAAATSTETRHLEFEITPKQPILSDRPPLAGQLFYYVCEGESGTCLFLKQNLEIALRSAE